MTNDKIRTLQDVVEIVKRHRKETNGKIITMNGVFDIMHLGHAKALEEVRNLCGSEDLFILGVDSDRQVKKRKGSDRPYYSHYDRATLLARICPGPHYITIFDFENCVPFVEAIKPDKHANGPEYPRPWIEEETVLRYGGELYTYKRYKDIDGNDYSTSNLINKILKSQELLKGEQ
ncbi:MAG: adenylyltransferase/cytidyltransferase family protein [Candidatus Nanoarchaeia archaeon]|nr:adenylyltransferase/cytidyltransferase family protein [Candidatus Nanoarchaeia archaeon]